MRKNNENQKNCCFAENNCFSQNKKIEKKSWFLGLVYGLLPHSFCIAFVVFSLFGSITLTGFFKKFLLLPNFFYLLILISLFFAVISAFFYLKKQDCLCLSGIKSKWRYLSILFFITIFTNLFTFKIIMPVFAKIEINGKENDLEIKTENYSQLLIKVEIPCAGHSALIIDEIKKNAKVSSVKFLENNEFLVEYDKNLTNKKEILDLEIFKTYKAEIIDL